MAVAIIAAMLFVVIDPVYKFLGEYAVWIVVTVGELSVQHACVCSKTCPLVQRPVAPESGRQYLLDPLGIFVPS